MLVLGHALGVATSVMTALAFVVDSAALRLGLLVAVFVSAGAYVATEDAIEAALTADFVPQRLHNIGYGVLGATNGVGDLIPAPWWGFCGCGMAAPAAFLTAAAIMLCGTVLLARAPASAPEC